MYYDVVIIGAGPAGATLARLLDKGFKVAIIDKKSSSSQSFKKPCGGLLAPDSQKSLSKFGLAMSADILASPQIFAVETIDVQQNLKRYYQRFYLNLDRHKFDLWLMSLIPKNVEQYLNAFCSSISKQNDIFSLEVQTTSGTENIDAKYVIGADGAGSMVRKLLNTKPIRQYLSIQKNYKASSLSPYYVCLFDKRITDCYCWLNTKDNILQLGGAFNKHTAKKDFAALESYFKNQGYNLDEVIKTEACLVNRPKSVRELCVGKNNVLLIGEAAGFISTSSLEGISFAIDSAVALADAFNKQPGNVCKAYGANSRKLRLKVLSKIAKSPFMHNPLLRGLVMKSGITAIK